MCPGLNLVDKWSEDGQHQLASDGGFVAATALPADCPATATMSVSCDGDSDGKKQKTNADATAHKKTERSRTRTVQIPSRFKDFSTVTFTTKKAKLELS
jgi:hypothetical protein